MYDISWGSGRSLIPELHALTFWVRAREIRIQNMHKSCPGVPTPADPPPSRVWWPNLKNLVHTVAVEP